MGEVIERVEALAAQWERDAAEHLDRFGQHMPCSVEVMAEQLRAALDATPSRGDETTPGVGRGGEEGAE